MAVGILELGTKKETSNLRNARLGGHETNGQDISISLNRGHQSQILDRPCEIKRHPFGCLLCLVIDLGEGYLSVLCLVSLLALPRFIPERQFDPVPQT